MTQQPWHIHYGGTDLLITGPGGLEIVLHGFDASRFRVPDDLPTVITGSLLQRSWVYPLEDHIPLQLISIADTARPDADAMHLLHVGTAVSWYIPEDVAEALHALRAGPPVRKDLWIGPEDLNLDDHDLSY